jgi:hypothetical protein
MKKLLSIILTGLVLFGCSNSNQNSAQSGANSEHSQVVISNDMENAAAKVPSWINEKSVVKMENGTAHSGEFVSKVDDKNLYSYAYRENLNNISEKLPTRIIVNGWVNSPDASQSLAMVLDINDNGVSQIWKSYGLTQVIKSPNTWYEFTAYYAIDKPIKSDNQLKIYGFSGQKTAFFDDLKITIEY